MTRREMALHLFGLMIETVKRSDGVLDDCSDMSDGDILYYLDTNATVISGIANSIIALCQAEDKDNGSS